MANNRFRDDIRHIAQTDALKKLIKPFPATPDKPPILSQRGIGYSTDTFSPCQTVYSSSDGSYNLIDILSGTAGPRITDGTYNSCDQLNTIKGMYVIGSSPQIYIILKPDGVFLQKYPDVYWYTSANQLLNAWVSGAPAGFTFDAVAKWAYPTQALAAAALQAEWQAQIVAMGYTFSSSATNTLVSQTLTDADLTIFGSHINTVATNPFAVASYNGVFTGSGGYSATGYDYIVSIPTNYDFTVDTFGGEGSPPIIETVSPSSVSAGTGFNFVAANVLSLPGRDWAFELAIDQTTRNWTKDPAGDYDVPLAYSSPVSALKVGFATSRYAIVTPAINGGFMIYEIDGSNTPINNAYVYRADRTLSIVVPVAQMATYAP